ncbi:hypothetical protein [Microbulbifer variabilis]|uniref:hypothetical protein n=1 Tax=Microbulbifer variabilis TaxID=266805 RepID=UPI001CFCFF11|nr:hypothetical protein [Microbulbifer variabilis]
MKREAAIVLAPVAGGLITVLAGYLIAGISPADSSDIHFAVVALGFPVALLLSLLAALFIHPQLAKRNIFKVPVVGSIGGGIALLVLLPTGLPLAFLLAGALWGILSGVFYCVFSNPQKL